MSSTHCNPFKCYPAVDPVDVRSVPLSPAGYLATFAAGRQRLRLCPRVPDPGALYTRVPDPGALPQVFVHSMHVLPQGQPFVQTLLPDVYDSRHAGSSDSSAASAFWAWARASA